jgi:hypothetical protein
MIDVVVLVSLVVFFAAVVFWTWTVEKRLAALVELAGDIVREMNEGKESSDGTD